jgi:hypothetical protein
MDTLMARPCAQPFLHPLDPSQEDIPNYAQLIKHPMDLTLVQKRLANNEYQNVGNWYRDMALIWMNAEKLNNPYQKLLAIELHRRYEKEYERVKLLRLVKWSRVVLRFKGKIEALYDRMPPYLGAMRELAEKETTETLKPFSEEELNVFIRMSLYLTDATDARRMAKIIQDVQPDYQFATDDQEVDVNDLSLVSLHALRKFVTYRLAEMNIAYPK